MEESCEKTEWLKHDFLCLGANKIKTNNTENTETISATSTIEEFAIPAPDKLDPKFERDVSLFKIVTLSQQEEIARRLALILYSATIGIDINSTTGRAAMKNTIRDVTEIAGELGLYKEVYRCLDLMRILGGLANGRTEENKL